MTLNRLLNLDKPWFTHQFTRNKNYNLDLTHKKTPQKQKPLLSIHHRKSLMQGIISTDEAGAERKETTMTLGWQTKRGDEMMEVQGHLRKLGL